MTKSQTITNPKVIIPGIFGIALLAVVLTMFSPILAISESSTSDSSKDQKMPEITGSVNVKDTIKNYINANQKISFSVAASTVEKQVENGSVVGGHVGIEQGYLVYTFCVIDTKSDTSYNIIIDAGNGKVLNKSEGMSFKSFGHFGHSMPFGSHGMKGFGEHGKMMSPQGFDEPTIQDPTTQG
jgi:uncharacterized membrane protein YkoI